MVTRSAYYAEDGRVKIKTVQIAWDLGFTADAKWEYTRRIFAALGDSYNPVAEVTSASPNQATRKLSPIFVTMTGEQYSVEDWIQQYQPEDKRVFHWVYLISLTDEQREFALRFKCYTDVFLDPNKGYTNSQAYSLALLQLMNGDYTPLSSLKRFLEWYDSVEVELI